MQWRHMSHRLSTWRTLGLAVCLSVAASALYAQPAPPAPTDDSPQPLTDEQLAAARAEMDGKIETLLKELEVFYKVSKDSAGNPLYTVLWEDDGGSTKLTVNVKKTGTYRHKPLFVVYAYAVSASLPDGQELPPEVIRTIGVASDDLVMGGYSVSAKGNMAYSNTSAFLNEMSAGEMWMTLAQAHQNNLDLKAKIDPMLSGKN